jgi:hypothetical protein
MASNKDDMAGTSLIGGLLAGTVWFRGGAGPQAIGHHKPAARLSQWRATTKHRAATGWGE